MLRHLWSFYFASFAKVICYMLPHIFAHLVSFFNIHLDVHISNCTGQCLTWTYHSPLPTTSHPTVYNTYTCQCPFHDTTCWQVQPKYNYLWSPPLLALSVPPSMQIPLLHQHHHHMVLATKIFYIKKTHLQTNKHKVYKKQLTSPMPCKTPSPPLSTHGAAAQIRVSYPFYGCCIALQNSLQSTNSAVMATP